LKLSRDGWGGLVVLAASLLLFWATLPLKDNPLVPIGPGFYPRIVLGLTAVLSLWLLIADVFSKKPPSAPGERLNYGLVALTFAVFGLYVGALPYLGFRIATGLYVAATSALLAPPRSIKSWAGVLVLAVLTSFLAHLVFERYLLVLLPRGRLTGF
jgi:putative tricarboxylic transport membrane protein